MNPTEQELLKRLLDTFEAWNKDLQKIRDDYKDSIKVIDRATVVIESQKKSTSQVILTFAPWVILALVLLLITVAIFTFQCGTITFQQLQYSVPCAGK